VFLLHSNLPENIIPLAGFKTYLIRLLTFRQRFPFRPWTLWIQKKTTHDLYYCTKQQKNKNWSLNIRRSIF